MKRILIVGATSAIAEAAARRFAAEGARLALAARNGARLRAVADDLAVRGAEAVITLPFEATRLDEHAALLEEAERRLGGLDGVLLAHGVLPDPAACERDPARLAETLVVNGVSVATLAALAAERLRARGGGCVAAIGSVAGDRGRASNYAYGASKALVDVYLAGLRHRLTGSGVRVVTVKPGLVDTPMTAHLRKGPLFASPERVGAIVWRAMRRADGVVYAPGWWRWVMVLIRAIPEPLFRRTRL